MIIGLQQDYEALNFAKHTTTDKLSSAQEIDSYEWFFMATSHSNTTRLLYIT